MHFKNIEIKEWQQFRGIFIDFDSPLTILTGANGSGKTSILNILARHSGWQQPSYSIPRKEKKSGAIRFISRFFGGEDKSQLPSIGAIHYSDNTKADLQTQNSNSAQYHIQISNQKGVECFFIPSHRAIPKYQPLTNIPTIKKNKRQAFDEVSQSTRERYFGNNSQSSAFFMKQALIGWATQGYGVHSPSETIMPADEEQAGFFEGFPKILKKILPETLGFERIEIRNSEIVFVCNGGEDEFLLETVSGGISSLIDIAWQIYMYLTEDKVAFTVIIDEIENHLHPTMQRQILGNLLEAFPNVRFIVSTHSPLIVGSVRDAQVYVLTYDAEKKVVSQPLDFKHQVKTATEILDEVLGVSFTMPIWAEKALQKIVQEYSQKEMTDIEFQNMRGKLHELGLERLMPKAITDIVEGSE